jgi:hypothetical protein
MLWPHISKTADYPIGSDDNKFILTQQNAGVIPTAEGKLVFNHRRYHKW